MVLLQPPTRVGTGRRGRVRRHVTRRLQALAQVVAGDPVRHTHRAVRRAHPGHRHHGRRVAALARRGQHAARPTE